MKTTLQATLSQRLTLTPQLTLSLKILAMNRLELDHYLEECIERNPMLESVPPQNETESVQEPPPRREVADQAGDNRWERLYQRGSESYDRMAHIQDHPTLCEALHLQLDQQPMPDDMRELAHAIVDSLDDDGLFRCDPTAFASEHCVDEAQLEHVLTQYIQTLEPSGIGARDITECLLLQLNPANPADRTAHTLLLHFQHLLGEDEQTLLKASGLQPEQLHAAMDRMRRLDPFPGHDLGGQGHIYVEPEILFIKNAEGGIDVEIPRSAFHRIHLNQRWQNTQWNGADKKFVDTAMQEANWIIHGLTQRRETLMKLGTCLARRQKRLLDIGFLGIKPLTMREVAEELGMHESTISRVVQGKYAATPIGTMPLKAFFSTGLQTRSGGTISSFRVQQRIKALIDSENADKPISDQSIAEKLQHEGIEIARRTVAKYREQIGLPSSSQRRRAAKSRQNQMRR